MAWSSPGNAHGTAHHRIDCVYARREGTYLVLTAHRLLGFLAPGRKERRMLRPHRPPSWRDWLALAVAVLALVALVALTLGSPVAAQEYMRFDGTVQWLSGQTLILALDTQIAAPSYVIVGQVLVAGPGPAPDRERR